MERSTLHDDLQIEILRGERLRATALATVMAGLTVVSSVFWLMPTARNPMARFMGADFPVGWIVVFYAAAFLYELGARRVLRDAIEARFRPPEIVRYVNATIETSIPTVMIALTSQAAGAEIALNSPLPMVYFLFISLSTLRLGAMLSIYTGALAGIEFTALGLYLLPAEPVEETFFASPWPVFLKSFTMVVVGAACGFVGAELRRRLVASLQTQGEKNRVIGMFGQYVNPAVVEQLLSQPIGQKGELRHVTIMFLDIRGFTAFAERRQPEEVVEYLNLLFGTMIALVNANHGIINKFLGDGFMACFGAPLSDGRDVANAVKAAHDIARAVEQMNADAVIPPTRIGIGLHAGPVVTGSVGSEERKEYTVIGDTVNLASRVEQLTKQTGSVLLVTDAVWQAVKHEYSGRALEAVTVKGRVEPVAIYSLL
jgi:adenylate cyclase